MYAPESLWHAAVAVVASAGVGLLLMVATVLAVTKFRVGPTLRRPSALPCPLSPSYPPGLEPSPASHGWKLIVMLSSAPGLRV